jgi:uncharacterized FlaG/YvyC family protein
MNGYEVSKIGTIGSEPAGSGYEASRQVVRERTEKENVQAVESAKPAVILGIGDIRVSFQVEGKNHEVVITVSDKESGQIIRTIPFDKMQDLSSGALFQYSK